MASGMLIQGKWATDGNKLDPSGKFKEIATTFRDRVTTDGSSGFKAEAGRYPSTFPCRVRGRIAP